MLQKSMETPGWATTNILDEPDALDANPCHARFCGRCPGDGFVETDGLVGGFWGNSEGKVDGVMASFSQEDKLSRAI